MIYMRTCIHSLIPDMNLLGLLNNLKTNNMDRQNATAICKKQDK